MTQDCTIDKIIRGLSDLESQLKVEIQVIPASKKATDDNNVQPSQRAIAEKTSWYDRFKERVRKIGKVKKQGSNHGTDSGGSHGGSSRNNGEAQEVLDFEKQKLQSDIRQMKAAFENLTQFQNKMSKRLEPYVNSKNLEAILMKADTIRSRSDDLKEIRKKISALKSEIPSLLYKQPSKVLSTTESQTAQENGQINETGSDINLPGLQVSDDFTSSKAFVEVAEKFLGLEDTQKQQCLLSFAVFPENREVKRTMLMYWWIGEGFINCDDPENSVRRILDDFSMKGLLERVEDERKLKPTSYKMEPHVHSAVIHLAKTVELFELYNEEGKLIMTKSKLGNVCLVRGSSLERKAIKSAMKPPLKTIFNSSERYPDFTFKWFKEMESLRVLYLGRWERTAKRHIEVESTEFLNNMKNLKNLRLASFQGISRIENLKTLVCALPKLVILDLRACYNLEVLPDDIGSLESLIYLDVSECYMLDRMPRGIASLSKLQVLKGFVISQADFEENCAIKHLVNLKRLSITVNKNNFTVEKLMESLKDLKQLVSLKISWGAREEKKDDGEEKVRRQLGQEDGNKKKVDQEDGKKLEGKKKTSPSQEPTKTNQKKPDDPKGKSKVEEGRDGDSGEVEQEEGKKHDEVKTESLKSEKEASPSRESIQKKPDDQKGKTNAEGDGDKGKADIQEGKKQDEVQAETTKSDKVAEGEKKVSSDTIQKNQDDKSQEGGGDKGKTDPVEGKKQDEVKAESSKSDNAVEGVKKASTSGESTDTIQKKPDKEDGEKEKVDLEEGKKKDEVKTESSKPDKVVEGNEKTSRPQESKDTIQSKEDEHKENSKVQGQGDGEKKEADLKKLNGGEEKTQKSDKTNKFGKKVSFSEAPIQKKLDDPKRDDAKEKEIHETASSSMEKIAPKESRSSKPIWCMGMGKETKKHQGITAIDTSKLPSTLKKLELECFPDMEPPSWLNPNNLDNLEKLSIKGGMLSRIIDKPPTGKINNCGVRTLRLKYLHEFEAEWKDLQALFPNMILFEKFKCPKVGFCPTDGNGVWRSQASPDTPT